jgi:hypothetical protein
MTFFMKFLLTLCIIIGSIFVTLLGAHIVLSVGNMYNLSVVTQYSQPQIFAFIYLIYIIRFKYTKSKNKDYTEAISDGFSGIISMFFYYLMMWGVLVLMYHLFFKL